MTAINPLDIARQAAQAYADGQHEPAYLIAYSWDGAYPVGYALSTVAQWTQGDDLTDCVTAMLDRLTPDRYVDVTCFDGEDTAEATLTQAEYVCAHPVETFQPREEEE